LPWSMIGLVRNRTDCASPALCQDIGVARLAGL
jgi:hypothetical protein